MRSQGVGKTEVSARSESNVSMFLVVIIDSLTLGKSAEVSLGWSCFHMSKEGRVECCVESGWLKVAPTEGESRKNGAGDVWGAVDVDGINVCPLPGSCEGCSR